MAQGGTASINSNFFVNEFDNFPSTLGQFQKSVSAGLGKNNLNNLIELCYQAICLMSRVFANGSGDWGVQSQIKSYQRLKKWYLMPPCLTLSIIK